MSPEFESLGSIAGAVAAVGLLLVGASGLGGLIVPRHGRGRGPALDVFLLQIALGLNLLAAVGLCLGMTKWLAGGGSRTVGLLSTWTFLTPAFHREGRFSSG